MKVLINIVFWGDNTEPNKEIRLYNEAGKAIGYGIEKLSDSQPPPSNLPQGDLFASGRTLERAITFTATLDLEKIA